MITHHTNRQQFSLKRHQYSYKITVKTYLSLCQVPECENKEVCPQEQDVLGVPGRTEDQQGLNHLGGQEERLRESEDLVQIWVQAAEEGQYD